MPRQGHTYTEGNVVYVTCDDTIAQARYLFHQRKTP